MSAVVVSLPTGHYGRVFAEHLVDGHTLIQVTMQGHTSRAVLTADQRRSLAAFLADPDASS